MYQFGESHSDTKDVASCAVYVLCGFMKVLKQSRKLHFPLKVP